MATNVDSTVYSAAAHVPAYVKPATVYFGTQPGEANATTDYTPGTMAEKATLLGVTQVTPVTVAPNEPYPVT
jgi:hypothetical protein